jgi:predicted TIM-barrel fold metal-dependent hydrolase
MEELGYRLIDADNHYYEPRDAFTAYIEPAWRDRAVRVLPDPAGGERIWVDDRRYTFNFTAPDAFTRVDRPGSLRERMRLVKEGAALVDAERLAMPMAPEFVDRSARLALMDAQGLEAAILLPSLGVGVERYLADDPPLLYANLHAFNRWLDETWGFAYADRIFSPPLLNLTDREAAVAELEWALGRGAKVVHLLPAPAAGRSPADPYFDPFWARIAEAGVLVAFHISNAGYNELVSTAWGEEAEPPVREMSAWQWTCTYGDRPLMDTMAALVLHNLFGRFPAVKVASIENGSLWVDYLLKAMDKYRGMGRHGRWIGGPVTDRPSRIFSQHVFVSPYHEEDVVALAGRIGPSQVLFGSDFPHPEGLAEPADFTRALEGLGPADVRAIMRDNTGRLLGIA